MNPRCIILILAAAAVTARNIAAEDKVTYQDHVLPLIQANCSKCHNEDKKKADLELTSYGGVLKGSGSGAVVISGNVEGSKLWKALTHAEEPNMPPNRPPLPQAELEIFRKWIAQGLLETATGKAVVAANPGTDLSLKAQDIGKPEGPPSMPENWPPTVSVHPLNRAAIIGLASSPWAPLIAVGGQKEILLFNSTNHLLLGVLPFTEGQPADLAFSRTGKLLLAAGGRAAKSGRVLIWDVTTGKQVAAVGKEDDTVLAADIRADQTLVALGGPNRLIKIFSTADGELKHKIKKHTEWITAIAFSPNGQILAAADRNGAISLWDPETAQELFTLSGHKSSVTALSWRADSKILSSTSEDGTVKTWDVKEGRQLKSWNAHPAGSLSVSYAHDDRLVTCGRDNYIIIWDGNGKKLRALDSPADLPLRAVFASDDAAIVGTDFSGHVTSWNVKDGKRIASFEVAGPVLATIKAR
jgi:WD40 repeat protein